MRYIRYEHTPNDSEKSEYGLGGKKLGPGFESYAPGAYGQKHAPKENQQPLITEKFIHYISP
jgi:hypothetical protein